MASTSTSSGPSQKSTTQTTGLDVWLQRVGKSLPVGGTVRIALVAGPPLQTSADPVDAHAPHASFPCVLKFPSSTVTPKFTGNENRVWKRARLYEKNVPPIEDDPDEEVDDTKRKKAWKYNRPPIKARQWVLQEHVEFLETMLKQRQKKTDATASNSSTAKTLSSRYEGTPEFTPSQYVLFSLNTPTAHAPTVVIRHLPATESTVTMIQPAARHTLSLVEAEQAIEDQRAGVVRPRANATNANSPTTVPTLRYVPPKVATTKSRLLNKLKAVAKADDQDEGDDVMANVTFRGKGTSGGGSKARRELLSTLGGDGGITVSDDFVLGGSNDAAFGGRQRFGASAVCNNAAAATSSGPTERGADGAAMADDFYTRDVSAEYEELDYDANEQFDDDDVDVGETELFVDDGEGDDHDEEDDDDEEDDEDADEAAVGGAAGLATVAGFKALLAKARGEVVAATPENEGPAEKADDSEASKKSPSPPKDKVKEETDHMSKIMAAAEKSRLAKEHKDVTDPPSAAAPAPAATDEHGLRYITLDAVRREIWLNHGSIPITRLIKIFSASKKHGAERQAQFRDVVKELCTMTTDPVHGRMLVLKQHYSHMN